MSLNNQFLQKKILQPLSISKLLVLVSCGLLFIWIANQNFFFTKTLTYHFSPSTNRSPVKLLNNSDLISTFPGDNGKEYRLADDDLKFSVKIPRSFAQATVTVRLNNKSQDALTLSAQAPVNAPILERLFDVQFLNALPWDRSIENGGTLWQRPQQIAKPNQPIRQFSSFSQLLNDPPTAGRVGVVGIDPTTVPIVKKGGALSQPMLISHNFRGSHTIEVFSEAGPFIFRFVKVDLNRIEGPDELTYRFISHGKVLKIGNIGDDGNVEARGQSMPTQIADINIPYVERGIYKLELTASDDVLINNIEVNQDRLTFEKSVFFADGPAYGIQSDFRNIQLAVRGSKVAIETPHSEGLQRFTINNDHYELTSVKKQVAVTLSGGAIPIAIPKGDVIVRADHIVVSPAHDVLEITPVALPITGSPNLDSLDYIWAPYQARETFGQIALTNTYLFSDLFIKSKTLFFTVHSPGLVKQGNVVDFEGIDVTLIRSSLPWHKLWEKVSTFITSSK